MELRVLGFLYEKRSGSKIASANLKEGDRVGAGPSRGTGCGGRLSNFYDANK